MKCAISLCFHVYLMHHIYTAKFDVMGNLKKFLKLNKAEIVFF